MSTSIATVDQQFWAKAKELLVERVRSNDFAFLGGLLKPNLGQAMQDALVFAAEQESFPDLPGLSSYLKKNKGHEHWKLTDLKEKGFVLNTGPGKGLWRLTSLPFQKLLEVPQDLLKMADHDADDSKRSAAPQIDQSLPKFRGKRQAIWSYLQSERVGDRLLVTSELLDKMAEIAGAKRKYVQDLLGFFERVKLLERNYNGLNEGVELLFEAKKASAPITYGIQAKSLIETLGKEIETLSAQHTAANEEISRQQVRIQQIEELMAKKTLVRDEIKRLAGITS